MGRFFRIAGGAAICAAGFIACSADNGSQLSDDDEGSGSANGGSGGGFDLSSGGGGEGGIVDVPCDNTPDMDGDQDGWTGAQGDCNDCTRWMNPGAYDYAGNHIDEDCNGVQDDTVEACDGALAVGSSDPLDAARAMDLCTMAGGQSWGVVSAEYVHVDGTPATSPSFHYGHGILTHFGAAVNPQGGTQLFALSSGAARNPTDPDYQDPGGFDKGYVTSPASGYPKESPSCPGVITGEAHDSIALRLRLKTPTNAQSFAFNVNMYTWEYPGYICSTFNDFVTVMMAPAPSGLGDTTCGGLPCGNISFDAQGNSLSVNAGFLEVCSPGTYGGKTFDCQLGTGELSGTGFEEHAATGWLQTTAPVTPGSDITLELGAWDSGDGILDTTGLFDNFRWSLEETPTGTKPIDDPK